MRAFYPRSLLSISEFVVTRLRIYICPDKHALKGLNIYSRDTNGCVRELRKLSGWSVWGVQIEKKKIKLLPHLI